MNKIIKIFSCMTLLCIKAMSSGFYEYTEDHIMAIRKVALNSYRGISNVNTESIKHIGSLTSDGEEIAYLYHYKNIYILGYIGLSLESCGCGEQMRFMKKVTQIIEDDEFYSVGSVKGTYLELTKKNKNNLLNLLSERDYLFNNVHASYQITNPRINTSHFDIVFTGFYDSGSLASLAAVELVYTNKNEYQSIVKLVTFAPLSLGDAEFTMEFKDIINRENCISFIKIQDYPGEHNKFSDFGKIGLPIYSLAEEDREGFGAKLAVILSQGTIAVFGTAITASSGFMPALVTIPGTILAVKYLPRITGIDPYEFPTESAVRNGFKDLKENLETTDRMTDRELLGRRRSTNQNTSCIIS